MHYQYNTSGTCSRLIDIEINPESGVIEDVRFTGGCHGNLQGIGALVKGLKPEQVIELAVKGMLPKGPLGRQMFRKLHVYAGPEHAHAAQKPEVLTF